MSVVLTLDLRSLQPGMDSHVRRGCILCLFETSPASPASTPPRSSQVQSSSAEKIVQKVNVKSWCHTNTQVCRPSRSDCQSFDLLTWSKCYILQIQFFSSWITRHTVSDLQMILSVWFLYTNTVIQGIAGMNALTFVGHFHFLEVFRVDVPCSRAPLFIYFLPMEPDRFPTPALVCLPA